MTVRITPHTAAARARRAGRFAVRLVRTEVDRARSQRDSADVALFHAFSPPPGGGGHQFLRALEGELRARGLRVEENRISGGTPRCLFNSFNFDFHRLRRFARTDVRMVHRVDGPIGTYRGYDDGTDRRILELNQALATATVCQSRYSLEKHRELGLELRSPVVIPNAVDTGIFHPPGDREDLDGRRIRVVATSWSDNPRKGSDALRWLDEHADFERFDILFVGRTQHSFRHVRVLGPVASEPLAEILRGQDMYVAASRDDPCSNALLEALACGLPAAYLRSGGHPELVGEAGIGWDDPTELPGVLDELASQLDVRRAAISLVPLAEVTDRYLEVLRG